MTSTRSTFPRSRAVAAWLQMGRLHAVNAVITGLWLTYFDVSVSTPFGGRSLPMYFLAPLLMALIASQPLGQRDSALLRQTPAVASGTVALARLGAAASLWGVGVLALWLRAGSVLLGLPVITLALAVASAAIVGEHAWAPLTLVFLAALPWVLSDAGTTQLLQWSADGKLSLMGLAALLLSTAAYVARARSRRPLRRAMATE